MKRLLSIILSAAILFISAPAVVANDNSFTEGLYTYEVVDGYATITEVDSDISGDITIPSTLGGYTVKHIGAFAFSFCSNITSITIPDGIKTIGGSAFTYCDFTRATIADSVISIGDSAFNNCIQLESIYMPQNLVTLGERVFLACYKLKEISIPDNVALIGEASFIYCDNLTAINVSKNNAHYSSVNGVLFNKNQTKLLQYPAGKSDTSYTIPRTVKTVCYRAFDECGNLKSINIPDSVEELEYAAFSWCYNLTSIVVPNSVTKIDDYVFHGCTRLTSVELPDGITAINNGMFYECRGFTKFEIPNTVTSIGDYAFAECDELAEIVIPDSVTQIGDRAFKSNGLKSITIPSGVERLGKEIFYGTCINEINVEAGNKNYCSIDGVLFNKNASVIIQYPIGRKEEAYTIPNSVKVINEWAFFSCAYIKSITVPQTLEKIGSYAFAMCTTLDDITIPDGVLSIGEFVFDETAYSKDKNNWEDNVLYINNHLVDVDYYKLSGDYTVKDGTKTIAERAFFWCYNLESVTIPDGVISIGSNAFGECYDLTSVTIPKSVTYMGETVFEECDKLTLCVYEGLYAHAYAVKNEIPYNLIKQIELTDQNVKVSTYEDVIPSDTAINVSVVQLPENITVQNMTSYDITLTSGANVVPLSEAVTVYIPVPQGADVKKCSVAYFTGDEKLVRVGATHKDGYMVFETDTLGTFAVFEKNYISGDVNGDSFLNNKDLGILMQHLNNWNVTINIGAADINADAGVNNKDYGLLMQYLNNWNVEFY